MDGDTGGVADNYWKIFKGLCGGQQRTYNQTDPEGS